MKTGRVKFFKPDRGFGFIIDDETNEEYFVHVTKCRHQIKKNDRVTFDTQEGKQGLEAVNVELQQVEVE